MLALAIDFPYSPGSMKNVTYLLFALLLGLLPSCQTPQATPALQAAELCRQTYMHSMDGHEALIRRSNPSQEVLGTYLAEAAKNKNAYDKAYTALLQAIGSMSNVDPNQITSVTNDIVNLIRASKGMPPLPPVTPSPQPNP